MTLAKSDDLEELGVLVMGMLWGLPAIRAWLRWEQCRKYGHEGMKEGLGNLQAATGV